MANTQAGVNIENEKYAELKLSNIEDKNGCITVNDIDECTM